MTQNIYLLKSIINLCNRYLLSLLQNLYLIFLSLISIIPSLIYKWLLFQTDTRAAKIVASSHSKNVQLFEISNLDDIVSYSFCIVIQSRLMVILINEMVIFEGTLCMTRNT